MPPFVARSFGYAIEKRNAKQYGNCCGKCEFLLGADHVVRRQLII